MTPIYCMRMASFTPAQNLTGLLWKEDLQVECVIWKNPARLKALSKNMTADAS